MSSIADLSSGQVIAVDGKTIRGAKVKGNQPQLLEQVQDEFIFSIY